MDEARAAPVYLTRRSRAVAAVIDAAQLKQLLEDAEELADIKAVDAAWEETEKLGETPVPWDDVKRDLGLLP
nr:type II toxin-antitoxin system Phd/YefM family antitoxin [Subtercola boreus]